MELHQPAAAAGNGRQHGVSLVKRKKKRFEVSRQLGVPGVTEQACGSSGRTAQPRRPA